jgi:ABC-2 type transport system permease protein
MLIASFLGFLIAKVSASFKKTNIIQTVLTFIFVIFCFSLRFIIEGIFRNGEVEATLEMASEITEKAAGVYLPAKWFTAAVTKFGISDILLLVGVSTLLFAVLFIIVGNSYRSINSALKSHAAAGKYKMTGLKKRSPVQAVVFKEFRRLTGSTVYMTNGAMGEILAVLFSLVTLVIGFDRIIAVVTQGAPVTSAVLQPAIPFIAYFFVGMMATTACSPSLEGKNFWIVQSLPVEKKTLYHGKMLFNMYLTVPFMVFSVLCMCISARTPVVNTVLYLILGIALCAFSTAWGCVCGIKHMRLDWENEIEVIKQGSAVALYMFPNMFAVMGLVVLVVFLGMRLDHRLLALILTLAVSLLAALCYRRAMALAKRTV